MASGSRKAGFTLIELMLVVAVIGILAAIAVPRFAETIRKSREGSTKGNLGAIRSALRIYYADLEGQFPSDLAALTADEKYLPRVPSAQMPPYHTTQNAIFTGTGDEGGWRYADSFGSADFGSLWVNCSHTDSRSFQWTSY